MLKKQYVIKGLTTLMYWKGSGEDECFTNRMMNAKFFLLKVLAEREIRIFSAATTGCRMSNTALQIIEVYLAAENECS